MKKSYQILILLVISDLFFFSKMQSQWGNWSDPISVTNSTEDNKNATIGFLYFIENDHYIFWERSIDSLSTSIAYKRFYHNDEPEVLISKEGVHYTNPKIISGNCSSLLDTSFAIFYAHDELGYSDINYQLYTSAGFLPPQKLSESTANKSNLSCNGEGEIIWLEEGKIIYTKMDRLTFTFSNPIVIDSGDNTSPTIIQSDYFWWNNRWISSLVAWINEENDSSSVVLREFDHEEGWLEPHTLFKGLTCSNLSFCSGIGQSNILIWDYFNDTSWKIKFFDTDANELTTFNFEQEVPFFPFFYSGYIPVKSNYFEGGFLSFIHQQKDTSTVLTSQYYGWVGNNIEDYQHVSSSNNPVNNTQVFTGKSKSGCIRQYFINIWEEKVNSHSQLKYVETSVCLRDIKENETNNISIETNPNPFSEKVSITFKLTASDNVVLSVLNASGIPIETFENNQLDSGLHVYEWIGSMYKPGLYFIQLQCKSGS